MLWLHFQGVVIHLYFQSMFSPKALQQPKKAHFPHFHASLWCFCLATLVRLKYLTSNWRVAGIFFCKCVSGESRLIHFKYSEKQVQPRADAGGGRDTDTERERERDSAEQILLISEEEEKKELPQCCACVWVSVYVSHKRMRTGVCCVHIWPCRAVHACVSVTGSQLCCSRTQRGVCWGEIRTARLLRGLAPPAHRQTQVRQTSFDVSRVISSSARCSERDATM